MSMYSRMLADVLNKEFKIKGEYIEALKKNEVSLTEKHKLIFALAKTYARNFPHEIVNALLSLKEVENIDFNVGSGSDRAPEKTACEFALEDSKWKKALEEENASFRSEDRHNLIWNINDMSHIKRFCDRFPGCVYYDETLVLNTVIKICEELGMRLRKTEYSVQATDGADIKERAAAVATANASAAAVGAGTPGPAAAAAFVPAFQGASGADGSEPKRHGRTLMSASGVGNSEPTKRGETLMSAAQR